MSRRKDGKAPSPIYGPKTRTISSSLAMSFNDVCLQLRSERSGSRWRLTNVVVHVIDGDEPGFGGSHSVEYTFEETKGG